jgi:hypothetical protein
MLTGGAFGCAGVAADAGGAVDVVVEGPLAASRGADAQPARASAAASVNRTTTFRIFRDSQVEVDGTAVCEA